MQLLGLLIRVSYLQNLNLGQHLAVLVMFVTETYKICVLQKTYKAMQHLYRLAIDRWYDPTFNC